MKTIWGYIIVYRPQHHRADANGYVREQILIMEEKLGRPLQQKETVHHMNHIRDDNRPENLMLLSSGSVHTSLHHKLGDMPMPRHPNGQFAKKESNR